MTQRNSEGTIAGLVLRPAERSDLPALAALLAVVPDPWTAQQTADELDRPDSIVWVADTILRTAGAAFFTFLPGDDCAVLQQVAVLPELRRKRVAAALILRAFTDLSARGARRCVLVVRSSNAAALALYESLGFHFLAVRKGLYSFPPEDGLALQIDL